MMRELLVTPYQQEELGIVITHQTKIYVGIFVRNSYIRATCSEPFANGNTNIFSSVSFMYSSCNWLYMCDM